MNTVKIAITIDQELLYKLDQLVKKKRFPNRSKAVQEAVQDKIERLEKNRLSRECSKLSMENEQALANEGLDQDFEQWPPY